MAKGKFSVTAAVCAFTFALILIFAGCGKKEQADTPETTAAFQTVSQTQAETTEMQTSQIQSTSAVEESTSLTAEETTEGEALPQTIPEIVEFFNESANRIKPEASKVVKNYERRIADTENLVVPAGLDSTAKSLMETFLKDDTEPIVYSTREEITSEFIVPNQNYVSRLTPDAVEKATLTDKGDSYVIYIKLKDESNPVTGKGVGSVCDIIEAGEVSDKVSFVEKFTTKYYNCEVTAIIDKASGKVEHITYSVPLLLDITVNLLGTHDASVGLTFVKDYTITY
ncbi:MAG: hypothetical protein IJC37_04775 [Clostridia bacterium]|nr:hypothetical protein [Clostridia bacterium]